MKPPTTPVSDAVSNAVDPVGSVLVHTAGGLVWANTVVSSPEAAATTLNGSEALVEDW